jgi:thiamine pyrophosphate-dependent acetolactate synthase large subunit-like protein
MVSGAEALVGALEAAGVEVVFGLPGVHNLAAWEALRGSPIRLVGVRHEQAAAYAADGYARASGRPGVALVTSGPGAANTLAAVGEAWASRSPVVIVATEVPTALRAAGGPPRMSLHECADQAAMFAPVTKQLMVAGEPALPGQLTGFALEVAAQPPARPVYVGVPADLLAAEVPEHRADLLTADVAEHRAATWAAHTVPAIDLAPALELLRTARRPLVWAGGGALQSGAGAAVAALATRLGAPAFETYSARGLLAGAPNAVGLPPHVPEAGALWDAADLVLAVGSDLDGMSTQNWRQPQPPALVAVNVDAADASKNYTAHAVIEADARAGVEALLAALDGADRDVWTDLPALRDRAWARLWAAHPREVGFLDAFTRGAGEDAVVLADMCIPGYWLAGLGRVAAPRRLQYPMGWGTLGYAFPASLGAACAATGRPVISVSGDGGFLFACGELATAAQERLALTAVIVDDGGYGMLRFDQRRTGTTAAGVDLHTPDFVALARAFGLRADAVHGAGEAFAAALTEHVADPAPTVLVARAAMQPPPTTSPRWYRAG